MNTAIIPTPKDPAWLERHKNFVREARQGDIDILFLGDSLTDWWREPGKGRTVWDEYFGGRRAANFGINADRTQHVLWRLQNGGVEGLQPRFVVLLVGTNNTGLEKDGRAPRNTPEETISGILAVRDEVRRRFPDAGILWHTLFPRGEELNRRQIGTINAALRTAGAGERTTLIDIGEQFLDADGRVDTNFMPDSLHLSEAGYRIWARALRQALPRP